MLISSLHPGTRVCNRLCISSIVTVPSYTGIMVPSDVTSGPDPRSRSKEGPRFSFSTAGTPLAPGWKDFFRRPGGQVWDQ